MSPPYGPRDGGTGGAGSVVTWSFGEVWCVGGLNQLVGIGAPVTLTS
jgi:hypothetical protein